MTRWLVELTFAILCRCLGGSAHAHRGCAMYNCSAARLKPWWSITARKNLSCRASTACTSSSPCGQSLSVRTRHQENGQTNGISSMASPSQTIMVTRPNFQ